MRISIKKDLVARDRELAEIAEKQADDVANNVIFRWMFNIENRVRTVEKKQLLTKIQFRKLLTMLSNPS